jgi:nucleoside-diphosphate-sugar epimerase
VSERGTVLLTGASGSLGLHLVAALRERRWRVRALVHRRPVPEAEEQVEGDLGDQASLRRAVDGADAVAHMAAVTHARRERSYQRVNAGGTANLIAAAREAGVGRFLQGSTRAISPEGGAYSRSKLRAEQLVGESGLPFVIVRLPEVYGAGSSEGIDAMISSALHGKPIRVVGKGSDQLCPIHIDDAVIALVAALEVEEALGRTYTLAGDCITGRELAEACREAFGSDSRIAGVPGPAVAIASQLARVAPLRLYPDQLARLRAPKPPLSRVAREDLGFRPRPLAEGLAQLDPRPGIGGG